MYQSVNQRVAIRLKKQHRSVSISLPYGGSFGTEEKQSSPGSSRLHLPLCIMKEPGGSTWRDSGMDGQVFFLGKYKQY